MGRHFTFKMTIQKDHQLITSGPYSVVRHPSYSANLLVFVASWLCLFGPGSYWQAAELWTYPVSMVAGGFYIIGTAYIQTGLFGRVAKEDEVLRQEFKEHWVSWAQRTPYRLIPFVY